jgi:pimeloyl-ACP methyl ester carboxylesterase
MRDTLAFITRTDGRRVALHTLAEGGGKLVVFCHPAPGSGAFDPNPEATEARGITLVASDRPGYGHSDPPPGAAWPSIADSADDLAALISERANQPVGVVGWSAGGRVALALAARWPELVDRAAVLATPAPHEQVPWIPPEQAAMLEQLTPLPPTDALQTLTAQLTPMLPSDSTAQAALAPLAACPADEDALALPGARERLAVMLGEAYAQGAVGMAADILSYCLRPWGFEASEVQAKTLLLYGAKDPVAGSRHGRWWQKQLPNARLEMVPEVGHMLVLPMWERVLSHLAPDTRRH